MLLDQPILEGRDTYAVLNHGILRWPASSTPDKGGNTVLIGHRFTYSHPQGVFYYLDKVKVGDKLSVAWGNKSTCTESARPRLCRRLTSASKTRLRTPA